VVREEKLLGIVTRSELERCTTGKVTREAVDPDLPVVSVYADQALSLALEKMGANGLDSLPVVSRADSRKWLGTITLPSALRAYGLHGK
jgi:CBS domain-containing protein